MKKLTLEHLAPYFPYGLKGIVTDSSNNGSIETIIGLQGTEIITDFDCIEMDIFKPILRPLSDLTKEIEHNGEKFVPIEWFEEKYYTLDLHKQCLRLLEEDGENWINQSDYMLVTQLLEWHFDLFGLLEAGLAIDINTLNTENDETN